MSTRRDLIRCERCEIPKARQAFRACDTVCALCRRGEEGRITMDHDEATLDEAVTRGAVGVIRATSVESIDLAAWAHQLVTHVIALDRQTSTTKAA